jgi:hypothetical protein
VSAVGPMTGSSRRLRAQRSEAPDFPGLLAIRPRNPMNDRNLLKGLFLAAVALVFGVGALRYNVGG